jgi:hypothetical protein
MAKIWQQIAALLRNLGAVHGDLQKISGSIEAASAKQPASKCGHQSPILVTLTPDHRAESQNKDAKDSSARQEGRDHIRLAVEIIALVVGFIVAGANILLWIQTKEATRIAAISAKAAQSGAAASQAQAEAARTSTLAAIDQSQLDQRAWVGVEQMVINDPPIRVGSQLVATVILANSGKTPALQVGTLASITVEPKGTIIKSPKYAVDHTDQTSHPAIQPGGRMSITSLPVASTTGGIATVSTGDFADLQSGKYVCYVYGRIIYKDIFARIHITHFCAFLNPNMTTVRACETYNDEN